MRRNYKLTCLLSALQASKLSGHKFQRRVNSLLQQAIIISMNFVAFPSSDSRPILGEVSVKYRLRIGEDRPTVDRVLTDCDPSIDDTQPIYRHALP